MSSTTVTNTQVTNTRVIKRPVAIDKTFRLIDFHVCDDTMDAIDLQAKLNRERQNEPDDSDDYEERSPYPKQKTQTLPKQFIIQMFGIDETGKTCSIIVNDYRPFFFVKVADSWTHAMADDFKSQIAAKLGAYARQLLSAQLIEKHQLYGFSDFKKHKFVQLTFTTMDAMNRAKNIWYVTCENKNMDARYTSSKKLSTIMFLKTNTSIYESNIPPVLRYFHIHNISPSGWIRLKTSAPNCKTVTSGSFKTTTCTYEYICSCSAVEPLPEKETRVPYKICSFDIEASSSHGDFPLPVKTFKRLASNMVDVFIRQFQSQKMDTERSNLLARRIIMAAFGFGTFDDVDLVYPKHPPSKTELEHLITIALDTSVNNASALDTTGEAVKLLTIQHAFQKSVESPTFKLNSSSDDEDDDEDVDEDEDDDANEYDDVDTISRKHTKKVEQSAKLVDILTSNVYSRDEKIQVVDEVLTSAFPKLKGDEVTFIGSTFMRYGDSEPYMNHCIVAGTCDPVDGCVIERAANERDTLMRWTDLIQRENPDIIIGYNIFGFDYEFMFRRAIELGCEEEFLILSRKKGELCANTPRGDSGGSIQIEHTTVQLASGEYDLRYFKMPGRLQVDMYTYFRRDFNLSSYKLDDVAGQFINDEIKRIECVTDTVTGREETWLYSGNMMGLHTGDYIHIELTEFTSDYYKNGSKFRVDRIITNHPVEETDKKGNPVTNKYNVIVISGHEHVGKAKCIRWGMAKDDVTPQDIFRLSKGTAADRAIVAKYCIQDCNLVHHLMNKIDVITGYVEMSRICSVPISFLVFRGQGIKLTSYVAKKCRDKNTLMPDLDKSGSNEGYEGAIVLPPKCSMYMDNPVACVDYSSLYPSSMISNNLSHDSKVWTVEYNLAGEVVKSTGERDPKTGKYKYDNLPGYEYINIEFDTFRYIRKTPTSRAEKVKSGKMVCRWAQFPDGKKGIMPSILEELLKARSDTRKMAKTEKDPFMQNILDKRQLGYKVTANSLYGQCGAKTSTFYEKDVAASTTATGRSMITYARRIIEEVYGHREYTTENNGVVLTKAEYVYGDSVTEYTPVYIRFQTHVHIMQVDELSEQLGIGGWICCEDPGRETKEYCEICPGVETWSEQGWTQLHRVIRHKLAPHKKIIRVLTNTGCVDCTDDHSLLRMDGTEVSPNKVYVGEHLMHHPLLRLCDENIYVTYTENANKRFDNMLEAALFANYLQYMGDSIRIHIDEQGYFCVKSHNENGHNKIISMTPIPYNGYVYDLTTSNHHFAAGIGNMIVHNTDSVFFTFNLQDPVSGEKIRGNKALEITIEIAQDAAHLCSQFLKPPMDLAYEKTLMPFVLLSKKRYVGMLYETDPNKGKLKYMGLSLKRRDSCDYLKDTYGGILNVIMKDNNIQKALQFLDTSITQLIGGSVSMDKLMITKALRSDYKNPQQIAHRVLADRIGKRDPGNKPKPGDRIKFLHVVHKDKNALQGDKIETPEFIVSNNIPIDYTFYITNQLMKPLQQLLGLALEQIWESMGNKQLEIRKFKKEMAELYKEFPDLEIFMKKKEKICSQKIKAIVFDKHLIQIQNERAGLVDIRTMFSKKK